MSEAVPNGDPAARLALLRKAFTRRVAGLASAARRVQAAADPEGTHDVRVSARGLDAMLRTWECLFRAGPRNDAIRQLRRMRRRLGRARELQVHVGLLEQRVARHGTPAVRLLLWLKHRLSRQSTRAAELLRARRLKHLLARIEAATSSLESLPPADPHVFARARARSLEAGAVARVSLRLAGTQEDEWMLHQARIATKKWRYAIECVDEIEPVHESRGLAALRDIQAVLGTFQDRVTLIAEIERYVRKQNRTDLRTLLEELEAEKQAAISEFKRLELALRSRPRAAARRLRIRPLKGAAPIGSMAPVERGENPPPAPPDDERWEQMAQWLLGKSGTK